MVYEISEFILWAKGEEKKFKLLFEKKKKKEKKRQWLVLALGKAELIMVSVFWFTSTKIES